ncbi:unnamed protein product [Lasius platythorax]|uniref:Uncharacterized protein n=1 Tax=Lasius platythorax TaxID=488582 RepID=A0AAV2N4S9_9HYME
MVYPFSDRINANFGGITEEQQRVKSQNHYGSADRGSFLGKMGAGMGMKGGRQIVVSRPERRTRKASRTVAVFSLTFSLRQVSPSWNIQSR